MFSTSRFSPRPGSDIAFSTAGSGHWIIFCHALASRKELWTAQMMALARHARVLSFDLRGHGESSCPGNHDYRFESLAADLIALMDHLDIAQAAALVGISVGGEVAQVVASRFPQRFERLILCSTACHTDAARAAVWQQRIDLAESRGMEFLAAGTAARWFSKQFAELQPDRLEWCRQVVAATPLEAYVGLAKVIRTMDLRPLLGSIESPTWVICGDEDASTGPATAADLAALIPGARLSIIRGAGHFPNIEAPADFNEILMRALRSNKIND